MISSNNNIPVKKNIIILFHPVPTLYGNESNYPWVLLYLERMVRHLDVELVLIDERLDKNYTEIIQSAGDRLLFAGVSAVLGYQVVGGVKFSETLKSITNAPVIWGGWFSTVYPELALNDGYADYICIGQGEIPFRDFTEKMLNGEDVSSIPGIGLKRNGKIILNSNDGLLNPDEFPRINLNLIDVNRLIDLYGKVETGYRGTDYLASTGCPNNCSFCNLSVQYKNKWYPKKISEIIEDLRYIKEKAGISQIVFFDNNFFGNKTFVMEFCNELIRSELSLTWDAQAQVSRFIRDFTNEDIDLLYKSGFRRIKVGAESGDEETLVLLNKKITVNDNLEILKVSRKHNICTRLHVMVCFPPDPYREFWQTLNLIGKAILIDRKVEWTIAFYYPIPKTPLYQICVDNGFVSPATTTELLDSFFGKATAPWYKRDYHKDLDHFVSFYYLFANPYCYLNYPLRYRPIIFMMTLFMYPLVYFRFKFNLMRFPIESWLFKKIIPHHKKPPFINAAHSKKRYLNYGSRRK
jgi:anaerobic magnesium-protoporphyrin IX monomethyl ester cyclase